MMKSMRIRMLSYCLDEVPRHFTKFIRWVCEDCKECHKCTIRSILFSSDCFEATVGPNLKRKICPNLGDECIHDGSSLPQSQLADGRPKLNGDTEAVNLSLRRNLKDAAEHILEIKLAKELKAVTCLSDVMDDGSPHDVNKGIPFQQCCKAYTWFDLFKHGQCSSANMEAHIHQNHPLCPPAPKPGQTEQSNRTEMVTRLVATSVEEGLTLSCRPPMTDAESHSTELSLLVADCNDMKNGTKNISQSNRDGKLNFGENKHRGDSVSGDVHQSSTDDLQYTLLPESHQCAEPVPDPTWSGNFDIK